MALNLSKDKSINLTKSLPNETKFSVGLAWDPGSDLDVSVIVLDANGKRLDMVYFDPNSLTAPGLTHSGDNRTGEGDGDDETVTIDLSAIRGDSAIVALTSYSHGAPEMFGASRNPVARLYGASGNELVKAELDSSAAFTTGLIFVTFTKDAAGDWNYTNTSESVGNSANGLADIIARY